MLEMFEDIKTNKTLSPFLVFKFTICFRKRYLSCV